RFLQSKEGILESYVSLDSKGDLVEIFQPSTNPRLIEAVQHRVAADLKPYLSEVNLFIDGWIEQCFAMLSAGVVFLIDYGFPRHEYYHPDRNKGTLMCHYRHHAHTNPLIYP